MVMRERFFGLSRSAAGAALVGLGIFVLYINLMGAANQLRDLLPSTAGDALGALPVVLLTASHVVQAYGSDHHRLIQGVLQHLLVALWPLALVIIGTVWSYDSGRDGATACEDQQFLQKKSDANVEISTRRSTSN
jgi:hypothetical protein